MTAAPAGLRSGPHPLAIGDLLDESWARIVARLPRLVLCILPANALMAWIAESARAFDAATNPFPALASLFATVYLGGLIWVAVAHASGLGPPPGAVGVLRAWGRTLASGPALLIVHLLAMLVLVPLIFLLVVPAVVAAVYLSLAPLAVGLEGARGVGALRRSWELVRGSWWRMFGLVVVLHLPTAMVSLLWERLPPELWIRGVLVLVDSLVMTFPYVALGLAFQRLGGGGEAIDPEPEPEAQPAVVLHETPAPPLSEPVRHLSFERHRLPEVIAPDPQAFHIFERAGWNRAAEPYHDAFAPLTSAVAPALLDAVGCEAGTRLLDVACGPGYVAAAAAARGAEATGVDFSAAMVECATRLNPGITFREGDAAELPFEDRTFDAVTINFGMLHFARPERAAAEACRVLRAGGRFAFTVWAKPEEAVAFGVVLEAVRLYGNLEVPLPQGPPFFRFADAGEAARILLGAGFESVRSGWVPLRWRVDSAEALFEIMRRGTVRTAALIEAQTPDALALIRAAVIRRAESYRQGDALDLPMPVLLATATRPEK